MTIPDDSVQHPSDANGGLASHSGKARYVGTPRPGAVSSPAMRRPEMSTHTPRKITGDGGSRGPARRTSKGDWRRGEILTVAADLFNTKGYHQTSVDDIAVGAGIRKPSLYYHFQSKEEILFTLHEEYGAEVWGRHEARTREHPGLSATESLREILRDMIGVLDVYPAHVRVFFHYEQELRDTEYHDRIQAFRDDFEVVVENVIRRGVDSGEFIDLDVQVAVQGFFALCNWTYRWYHQGGRLTSGEIADIFHSMLMGGIAAKA